MQLEGEDVYDFSENDPFSGGNYWCLQIHFIIKLSEKQL
jgi:hypothetical protein